MICPKPYSFYSRGTIHIKLHVCSAGGVVFHCLLFAILSCSWPSNWDAQCKIQGLSFSRTQDWVQGSYIFDSHPNSGAMSRHSNLGKQLAGSWVPGHTKYVEQWRYWLLVETLNPKP